MFGRCKVLFSLWVNSQIDLTIRNNRGRSVLHIAAAIGQADLIEFLVRKSCDVAGQTALHLAAARLDLRPISKLIQCGADVTVRNFWRTTSPLTPQRRFLWVRSAA
jgi:ankyrin repeat protein